MEDYFVYILLILSVLAGGIFVLYITKPDKKKMKLLLSFSGAFLLGICFTHIIPEVYESGGKQIGLFVLLGYMFQLILEFFSEGIEHGHIHIHKTEEKSFPVVLMISLCMHAFIEGIPLEREIHDSHHFTHNHSEHSLLLGIVFHNIPVSIALVSMFLQSGLTKKSTFFWLLLFALMGPLGTFCGHQFSETFNNLFTGFFDKILAIVVGMFLHISTTILFESSEGHRFNLVKFLSILAGVFIAIINP